jgi:branched-chain amino acid transport system ATP-binding protein
VVAVAAVAPAPAGGVLLETVGVSKMFGGLEAVRSVNFRLAPGEIRAIIGPNGAGKTTFVGAISGRIRADAGRVLFGGRDITHRPAHTRVMIGIVYTFQICSIFKDLPVYDNVALAAQRRIVRGVIPWTASDFARHAERIDQALDSVGLRDARAAIAGTLPYGHQRLLEIAMAMALEPRLLILDEPTQGLAPDEIANLVALLRRVAERATILLIEHNMDVVLDLARTVTVMDRGGILAEGTPREIEANVDVQRVYLGR